jgi:hypothetical protein
MVRAVVLSNRVLAAFAPPELGLGGRLQSVVDADTAAGGVGQGVRQIGERADGGDLVEDSGERWGEPFPPRRSAIGEGVPAGGVEDMLDERGHQRGLGGGVVVRADHIQGAASPNEGGGVEAGLFGVGEGGLGKVGVGEAADGVAEGLPDAGPGLLHHVLGLLQGAAHGGQSGMVAEDVGGFGVGVVLAPGHELRNRSTGQVGGEQVGGEDVDGAALEEPMIAGPVGAAAVAGGGDEGLGAAFRRLHRAAVLDRGPVDASRPVGGTGEVE